MDIRTVPLKRNIIIFSAYHLLLALCFMFAFSGPAMAKNKNSKDNNILGLYEGVVILSGGNEPFTIRLGKDGDFDMINTDELSKETSGMGLWKITSKTKNNVVIKAAYQHYMIEPEFGCSVDPVTGPIANWGCVFHVAVDATITPQGEMSGTLVLSIAPAQTPEAIFFTEEFPFSANKLTLDDLYDRAKNE